MSSQKNVAIQGTIGGRLWSNGRPFSRMNIVQIGGAGGDVAFKPSALDGDEIVVQLTATAASNVGNAAGTAIPDPTPDDEGRKLTFIKISNFAHNITFASDVVPLAAGLNKATFTADANMLYSFTVVAKSSRWYIISASTLNAANAGTSSVAWS